MQQLRVRPSQRLDTLACHRVTWTRCLWERQAELETKRRADCRCVPSNDIAFGRTLQPLVRRSQLLRERANEGVRQAGEAFLGATSHSRHGGMVASQLFSGFTDSTLGAPPRPVGTVGSC